eukprot:154650-Rhodomonas_salina.1
MRSLPLSRRRKLPGCSLSATTPSLRQNGIAGAFTCREKRGERGREGGREGGRKGGKKGGEAGEREGEGGREGEREGEAGGREGGGQYEAVSDAVDMGVGLAELGLVAPYASSVPHTSVHTAQYRTPQYTTQYRTLRSECVASYAITRYVSRE